MIGFKKMLTWKIQRIEIDGKKFDNYEFSTIPEFESFLYGFFEGLNYGKM